MHEAFPSFRQYAYYDLAQSEGSSSAEYLFSAERRISYSPKRTAVAGASTVAVGTVTALHRLRHFRRDGLYYQHLSAIIFCKANLLHIKSRTLPAIITVMDLFKLQGKVAIVTG